MITQRTKLPLEYGHFDISYHRINDQECVSFTQGKFTSGTPIVRIHSSCLFGESFHALDCDCAKQLTSTLKMISQSDGGVLIYQYAEGRGVGLELKIKALEIQRTKKIDTVEAFKLMGIEPDLRTYETAIAALNELEVSKQIKFATQNPQKITAIKTAGFEIIELLHPEIELNDHNRRELLVKKNKLGYLIESVK